MYIQIVKYIPKSVGFLVLVKNISIRHIVHLGYISLSIRDISKGRDRFLATGGEGSCYSVNM